jgi:hypothetical protein
LMRIPIGIISGIVLSIWKILVTFLALINFVVTLFSGKRNKGIAAFCEIWNTQIYVYIRYMTFVTNDRPFPFENMDKNMSKFK